MFHEFFFNERASIVPKPPNERNERDTDLTYSRSPSPALSLKGRGSFWLSGYAFG